MSVASRGFCVPPDFPLEWSFSLLTFKGKLLGGAVCEEHIRTLCFPMVPLVIATATLIVTQAPTW